MSPRLLLRSPVTDDDVADELERRGADPDDPEEWAEAAGDLAGDWADRWRDDHAWDD